MQITAGIARGIRLKVPQRGEIRPSTDYLRQSIFNRIGAAIRNATLIDGFAGTGAYGLEALSRGAKHCLFIEKNRTFIPHLQANIERVCKSLNRAVSDCTQCLCANFFTIEWPQNLTPNYIFFDPPYPLWDTNTQDLFGALDRLGQYWPQAVLILEHPSHLLWPPSSLWKPQSPFLPSSKNNEPQCHFFHWTPA